MCFGYGAVTHSGRPFQNRSPTQQFCNSVAGLVPCPFAPTTPRLQRHQALTQSWFRLDPLRSPLLGVSRLLSFPHGTEMFQFPWFPPPVLCVHTGVPLHDEWWVSPFGDLRIVAWSTAPRSFSQSPTSFIGSWRQGIHRWLFVAWKEQKMLVLALQFSRCVHTGACGAGELDAAAPPKERSGSFKTEEKTGPPAEPSREDQVLRSRRSGRRTRQCTNWDVHAPGDHSITDGVEWTP